MLLLPFLAAYSPSRLNPKRVVFMDDNNIADIYNEIPYIFQADVRTYPGLTGALGLLYGLDTKPLEKARILDLGCAQGANILPIAERFPGAYCVGVDLAQEQINQGKAMIDHLKLKNIELLCMDFQKLELEPQSFDYIITHGLFSWIPQNLQAPLIRTLQHYLAPQGLAHISFNTLPAWSLRLALKDFLTNLTAQLPSYTEKVDSAYAFLQGLQQPHLQHMRFERFLGDDIKLILKQNKHYIAHDFLEPDNHPIHYKDFHALCHTCGLQILGESQLRRHILNQLDPTLQTFYKSLASNELEYNGLYDFLNFRTFRNMLVCHEAVPLEENPLPSSFSKLYVSSPLKPDKESLGLDPSQSLNFSGKGKLSVTKPLDKAVLLSLAEAYPNNLSLEELLKKTAFYLEQQGYTFEAESIMDIIGFLFYAYTKNQIDFWTHPLTIQPKLDHPLSARPLNRYLAKHTSHPVINEHYEMIQINDAQKAVLCSLDGTQTLQTLAKKLKLSPKVILKTLETLAQHVLIGHN